MYIKTIEEVILSIVSPIPRTTWFYHWCWTASSDAITTMALAVTLVIAFPLASHAGTTIKPCDTYGNAGTPCVAAHSMTRALYADYAGPLYAVSRLSDGEVRNISVLAAGGYADAAKQDAFCLNTACTITKIYDQSPAHNDLSIEGGGIAGGPDIGAPADALPVTVGGHQVYGLKISTGMGYRNNRTFGIAKNGEPETMYMVTSGTNVNNDCCFDYGNAELTNKDKGNGHMDAINFSTMCKAGNCGDSGPWVRADMENGLFPQVRKLTQVPTLSRTPYVTALLKNNGQDFYAIKVGNAQNGSLTTTYSGGEPTVKRGYSPMRQEGGIVLGTGGDNSNRSIGSFFEGVMTTGVSSDEADRAVQANVVSVGYGAPSSTAHHAARGLGVQSRRVVVQTQR